MGQYVYECLLTAVIPCVSFSAVKATVLSPVPAALITPRSLSSTAAGSPEPMRRVQTDVTPADTLSSAQGVVVFCQVQPAESAETLAVQVVDDRTVEAFRGHDRRQFVFDGVLGPDSQPDELLAALRPLADIAATGGRACLMSYGGGHNSTGSITPALVATLFSRLTAQRSRVNVNISALEVLGDSTRDLLAAPQRQQASRTVRQDTSGRAFVPGLTAVSVSCAPEADRVVALAESRRSVDMNAHLIIVFTTDSDAHEEDKGGKLTVVSLARPERAEPDSSMCSSEGLIMVH